ncbi:9035_t:CDS:2 [Paraglomus occultum]|uniref:ubiquitinyl hydrolase 1 n=1 Tax=Paraglomus occultum TaxID=144539 RepID=A0A9N9CQD7_9GLOM|nr:9035_t:CDS:2 [Paraglomus occultum]
MGGGPPEGTDDPFLSEAERAEMMNYNERFSGRPEMEERVRSNRQMADEATADQIEVSTPFEDETDSNTLNRSFNELFGVSSESRYSTPAHSGEFNNHETDEFSPAAPQTQYTHNQGSATLNGSSTFGVSSESQYSTPAHSGEFNSHEFSSTAPQTQYTHRQGSNGSFNDSFGISHESQDSTPAHSGEFNNYETDEFSSAAPQTQYTHKQGSATLNGSFSEPFGVPNASYNTPVPSGDFNNHETDEFSLAAPQTDFALIQNSTYEDNWSFEQSVMKREAEKNPFVGRLESIEELMREYEHGSESYRQKIQKLAEKHGKIRRCRGDGNCFYRALVFAWFERLLHSKSHHLIQKAIDTVKSTYRLLLSASFQQEVIEDFYDGVYQLLQSIAKGNTDDESLWSAFQVGMTTNSLVWYFRAVTSAFLKKNRDEFEPFLEVDMDMDQYCGTFVEVMDKEADHIHVTVLTRALRVPVEIAYLSGSEALEEVNFHEFYPEPEEDDGVPTVPLKPLVLLYRPGHYDILYRNE